MHDSRNRRFAALGILGVAASMSCGESPTAVQRFGPPASLNIVTGNRQTGPAGQALPEPLTVQVLDAAGHPLWGQTVNWTVLAGNGTLFARAVPTETDSAGLVLVVWQLGAGVGPQGVLAQAGQGLTVAFSATAAIPASQQVSLVSGGGQQDTVGATLAQPLVIRVLQPDGTPDAGAAVSWRAIGNSGSYSPANTETDAQGLAQTSWTLGTKAGSESTKVSITGHPPLLIITSALPGEPVRISITPHALAPLGVIGSEVSVSTSAWDRYNNPRSATTIIGVADTTIAHVNPYNRVGVDARHHGSTFVTAERGALRDSVPLTVLGFTGFSVGADHVCGSSLDGDAYCWGEDNANGAIGDGTTTTRPYPTLVSGGLGLQPPSTSVHTCALDVSGHAYCWGLGQSGELGDGSPNYATELRQLAPVPVAGDHLFSRIQSGSNHTCAVATNGEAYCWGANDNGQLGRDTLTKTCYGGRGPRCSDWPILVTGGLQFASVTTSEQWWHSCGVTTAGEAYCWGLNATGELGSGSAVDSSFTPVQVQGGITFTSVSAGDYFTCGVSTAGDAYCWGWGIYGQLGDGTFNGSRVPVKVTGGLTFADVQAGYTQACGLTTAGKVYCWGGYRVDTPTAVAVLPDVVFTSLRLGSWGYSSRACALTSDNDLYCWLGLSLYP